MSKSSLLVLPLTVALFASYSMPGWAQGSSVAAANHADPADAAARVPPLAHQSSFAAYRGFSEQEVKDWRENNDNVGRIGGWRAYAQESRPSKPAAKNPAAPVAPGAAAKPEPAARSGPPEKSPPIPPRNPSGASTAPAASGGGSDAHQQHH